MSNDETASSSGRIASAKHVYAEIRNMILEFELYPGTRVTETELAARFNVSRTPIREAVQRLGARFDVLAGAIQEGLS